MTKTEKPQPKPKNLVTQTKITHKNKENHESWSEPKKSCDSDNELEPGIKKTDNLYKLVKSLSLQTAIYFTAVGMRFIGNYRFNLEDNIKLEKEDDNKYDSNAIKILAHDKLDNPDIWTHVAYVSKNDNTNLRKIKKFENYKIIFIKNFHASTKLALILE